MFDFVDFTDLAVEVEVLLLLFCLDKLFFEFCGGMSTSSSFIDASLFLKAKRGDAILWLHTTRDQKDDGNATGVGECVYAGGKVGEKWTAVKYLHLVTTQK